VGPCQADEDPTGSMRKVLHICGAVVLAAGLAAADFPLKYRAFTADQIAAFPRSYGSWVVVSTVKPKELKGEPPATSGCPLYGQWWQGGTNRPPVLFRLDESKGNGKGYARLIMDLNRDGDLANDVVVLPAKLSRAPLALPEDREEMFFGPVILPANGGVNLGPHVFFVQTHLSNRQLLTTGGARDVYYGQLRVKTGWYLETVVNLPGVRRRVAVMDDDGDGQLGESWRFEPSARSVQADWGLVTGDSLLQGAGGGESFENRLFTTDCSPYPFTTDCSPFSPITYFGAQPWKIALSADSQVLHVEPWAGPLAELLVTPNGKQVRSLSLAWENPAGQWRLIKPTVVKGKALVPPGNYRVYGCLVEGKAGLFHRMRASAFDRSLKNSFSVEGGKTASVSCGAPMEIKVTADIQSPDPKNSGARMLRISAKAVGAGGETYSAYGIGKSFDRDPRRRRFVVTDHAGQKVGSGNLEFG
jgi:hypothetical protein